MIKVKVYNSQGEASGEMDFPKVLETAWNPSLVHQVVNALLANRRQPIAHTKGRGDVRGGGKKPWKQKGTGRARHGSIRSPLWKGGGVTFGPSNEKIYTQKINKQMAKKAFLSVLSKKASEGEVKVLESFELANHKTKSLAAVLRKIIKHHSAALVAPAKNKNLAMASRNLAGVTYLPLNNLSVHDLLKNKEVLFEKSVLENYGK